MSLINRILGRENRSTSVRLSDPYLAEFFGNKGGLHSHVDINRASGLAVAQSCISVVSQSLASVPLPLYRKTEDGGREKATDHPLYAVLSMTPNEQMTAFEARELLISSLLIHGNAYARLVSNGRGQVSELHPLNASMVAVERLSNGRLRYRLTDPRGQSAIYLQEEILHLRYRLAPDGIMGLSPLQMARETFNLALTQQEQSGKQADRAFRTEGILSFPNMIGNESKDFALAALEAKIESKANTNGVLALDGGVTFNATSMTAKDAEFLDSRKLTNLDIARIFNVPPTVAGITDNATYSNVDGESRALVVRCLAPMARRIEQAMNAALLTAGSRKNLFIEHDLAGLMRGDQKARFEAYRIGREWGWLSPNEIRGWENLSEIENGNEYMTPLNMTELGAREENSDE